MSCSYRLAQINFARLRAPLSDPRMERFVTLLRSVNTLAEASPGFVWRMDEQSAAASGDRLFPHLPPGTTLINLSVWKSVGALQRYANLGKDGGIMNTRQSFFNRFEGSWVALWWVPEGHFPEVAAGWARLQHLRLHQPTPYAFNFVRPFPPPTGAEDYFPRLLDLEGTTDGSGKVPEDSPMEVRRAGVPWYLGW